jgi:alginate O-acetyltransferase complex protein AlgI
MLQAIAWMVESYRGNIAAPGGLFNYTLYLSFFPKLTAGPIARAEDFLPQLAKRPAVDSAALWEALTRIIFGLFKKLAIADNLGVVVDPVFADLHASPSRILLATYAFAVQIYCDFSGYSDIALGTARMFGYRLPENFNWPYLARNPADFWRRWHISLSTWLRDYLFLPLGGSWAGEFRVFVNYLLVMTLCGLWHGAAWPFVMFGAIHGLWLALHRLGRRYCQRRPALDAALQSRGGTALRMASFLFVFLLTLVVFRTPSLGAGARMFAGMVTHQLGEPLALKPISLFCLVALVALAHIISASPRWNRGLSGIPSAVRGLSYAAAISLALLLAPDSGQAFIYFQF